MRREHVAALIAVVVMAVAAASPAARKIITRTNGTKLIGEVTKTEGGYTVQTKFGPVTVPADEIANIEDVVTLADQLTARLSKIDQKNPDALYEVARWAYQQMLLSDAKDILTKAVQIKPDHEAAAVLLRVVTIRMTPDTEPKPDDKDEPTTRKVAVEVVDPSKLLKEDDIYRIRLLELDERSDLKIKIDFRNNVLDRFVASMRGRDIFKYPEGEKEFLSASAVAQARYLLEHTGRGDIGIRGDILVEQDPSVFKRFKKPIWPLIAKNCARTGCHDRTNGKGGLKLFNPPTMSEKILYTNFFTLHRWSRGGRSILNRDNIEMSLLLQYGLDPKIARLQHPQKLPTPVFRSPKDSKYGDVKDWISSLYHPLFPKNYGVRYIPMGQEPQAKPVGVEGAAPLPANNTGNGTEEKGSL